MITKRFQLALSLLFFIACGDDGKAVLAVTTPSGSAVFYSNTDDSGAIVVAGVERTDSAAGCELSGKIHNSGIVSCNALLSFTAVDRQGISVGEGKAEVPGLAPGAETGYRVSLNRSTSNASIACAEIANIKVYNRSECQG